MWVPYSDTLNRIWILSGDIDYLLLSLKSHRHHVWLGSRRPIDMSHSPNRVTEHVNEATTGSSSYIRCSQYWDRLLVVQCAMSSQVLKVIVANPPRGMYELINPSKSSGNWQLGNAKGRRKYHCRASPALVIVRSGKLY